MVSDGIISVEDRLSCLNEGGRKPGTKSWAGVGDEGRNDLVGIDGCHGRLRQVMDSFLS